MRHLKAGRRLARTTEHRKAMLRTLITQLLEHERVQTTSAKAKEARQWAEKIITLAKRGDLACPPPDPPGGAHQKGHGQTLRGTQGPLSGPRRRLHPHYPSGLSPGRRRAHVHPGTGGPAGKTPQGQKEGRGHLRIITLAKGEGRERPRFPLPPSPPPTQIPLSHPSHTLLCRRQQEARVSFTRPFILSVFLLGI
jgi:hypothetical protein